jgi:hypothetical protein
VRILNPFGEDNALMRTTLAVSLCPWLPEYQPQSRRFQDLRDQQSADPFARAFLDSGGTHVVCVVLNGEKEDFFTAKGVAETLFDALGVENADFSAGGAPYYHPGRKAIITVNGSMQARLEKFHPDCLAAFEIPGNLYMAELELDVLFGAAVVQKKYKALPRFPAVDRDIALVLSERYNAKEIQNAIREAGRRAFGIRFAVRRLSGYAHRKRHEEHGFFAALQRRGKNADRRRRSKRNKRDSIRSSGGFRSKTALLKKAVIFYRIRHIALVPVNKMWYNTQRIIQDRGVGYGKEQDQRKD